MSLGARLAIVFAAVAAATAVLVGGLSYVTTDRQATAEIDDFLRRRAAELTDGLRDQPSDRRDGRNGRDGRRGDDDDGNGAIDTIAFSPDAEVQVLDREGAIVANTGLLLPIASVDELLAEQDGTRVLRSVTIDGVEYRMITAHLAGVGAVQVARSLDETRGLLEVLQVRMVVVAGAVALLAAGAGWVVAQRTTRPLRALTAAVDEVAATQEFSVPDLPTSGPDEVGRLARGFDRMLGALAVSRAQQRRLVQDAAHELRTPLTSMMANVDWLMRAPDVAPEARQEALAGVRRELGELNDVINEIVQLATDSHEPPDLVPTDLASVVEDVATRFVRRTGRRLDTSIIAVEVMGDGDALARATTNLLSNADKYSPVGAPIGLEAGPDGVFVDDAGSGIPVDERSAVIDRFYRRDEDRSKPGSGLGLSIVAGIVDQHGGRLIIGDSPLGGARVGFVLPAR